MTSAATAHQGSPRIQGIYCFLLRTCRLACSLHEGADEHGHGHKRHGEKPQQPEVEAKVVLKEEVELEDDTRHDEREHSDGAEDGQGDKPADPVRGVL